MRDLRNLNPAEQLATLLARVTDNTHAEPASDGPPERVIAEADCEYFAEREEAREQRWRDGGAA